jgi:hypothetical protein
MWQGSPLGGLHSRYGDNPKAIQGQNLKKVTTRLRLLQVAFLDESSSALDSANEAHLYSHLQRRIRCYVSVGHRLSLVKVSVRTLSVALRESVCQSPSISHRPECQRQNPPSYVVFREGKAYVNRPASLIGQYARGRTPPRTLFPVRKLLVLKCQDSVTRFDELAGLQSVPNSAMLVEHFETECAFLHEPQDSPASLSIFITQGFGSPNTQYATCVPA